MKAHGHTVVVNTGSIHSHDPAIPLRDLSCIYIPCDAHAAHVYYLILPAFNSKVTDELRPTLIPENEEIVPIETYMSKQADNSLIKKWGMNDRENLKKWLLIYGYGRWKKLRETMSEGGAFSTKPIPEIRSFATAFVRTIVENLPMEKTELKRNLLNMLEEKEDDFYIPARLKDWGMIVRQRSIPWAKRIWLLYSIRDLIKRFKNAYKGEQLRWSNLLNFMPTAAFYGQRPSAWWTRRHDIDLIRGTYTHGYANYNHMRSDTNLSFSQMESDTTFKEFPTADTITRRLKKLMASIEKIEEYEFDKEQQYFENTDWTIEEKEAMLSLISDYGVPVNLEGKNDWNQLKEKFEAIMPGTDKSVNNIERIVQHLRMLAQHVIHPDEEDVEVKDADGFSMTKEAALALQNSLNQLQFIRKYVLKNGSELFNNELQALEKATERIREENRGGTDPWLFESWRCDEQDRGLLNAVADSGLGFLDNLAGNAEYGFENIEITPELAQIRIQYLCEFFHNIRNLQKFGKKKRPADELTFDEKGQIKAMIPIKKAKISRLTIPRDDDGNIQYPIMINNSLTILNLGQIETERPGYHKDRNIFPIGFQSIREHSSMFSPGERMQYYCEILDGGPKPLFRVTPMKDGEPMEEHSIVKDSSTGCWIVICNRVNEMQRSRRSKVTVSGTERFGLWDPSVVKLIHELPGAELLVQPIKGQS